MARSFALPLALPWRRQALRSPIDTTHQITQADRLRQQRLQAHRAYISAIGEVFGVELASLTPAQLIALSRFVATQQRTGLPIADTLLASLAGLVLDLGLSDDTIAVRLKQAPALRVLTTVATHRQVCAAVLAHGLVAVAQRNAQHLR